MARTKQTARKSTSKPAKALGTGSIRKATKPAKKTATMSATGTASTSSGTTPAPAPRRSPRRRPPADPARTPLDTDPPTPQLRTPHDTDDSSSSSSDEEELLHVAEMMGAGAEVPEHLQYRMDEVNGVMEVAQMITDGAAIPVEQQQFVDRALMVLGRDPDMRRDPTDDEDEDEEEEIELAGTAENPIEVEEAYDPEDDEDDSDDPNYDPDAPVNPDDTTNTTPTALLLARSEKTRGDVRRGRVPAHIPHYHVRGRPDTPRTSRNQTYFDLYSKSSRGFLPHRPTLPGKANKMKYKPSELAYLEILHYTRRTCLEIPQLPFQRCVREMLQDLVAEDNKPENNVPTTMRLKNKRFQATAMQAIQESFETYLVDLFDDVQMIAEHRDRKTIMPADIHLARSIRGEEPLPSAPLMYRKYRSRPSTWQNV